MANTANPIITMIVGTAPNADDRLVQLAAHYGATRTHDGWPRAGQLEPGDLVLVNEVPADLNMIAVNVILLPDNRGVLFRQVALADALADLDQETYP